MQVGDDGTKKYSEKYSSEHKQLELQTNQVHLNSLDTKERKLKKVTASISKKVVNQTLYILLLLSFKDY